MAILLTAINKNITTTAMSNSSEDLERGKYLTPIDIFEKPSAPSSSTASSTLFLPTTTCNTPTNGPNNTTVPSSSSITTAFPPPDLPDPSLAINWLPRQKWHIVFVLALMTFVTPLASSMFTPSIAQVLAEFSIPAKSFLGSFAISIYILGYASGPLLIAPLSELYGRLPMYHTTNVLFVAFTVGCALAPSMTWLLVFRLLAGMTGSAVLNLGGGTIADMFAHEQRGTAMSIWTVGPLLGPVIGPVAGGFLGEAKGWRWAFWVIALGAGVVTVGFWVVMRETYPPVILRKREKAAARKASGDSGEVTNSIEKREVFWSTIVRPLKMLVTQPVVFLTSVFIAVVYGLLYLLFTTMPIVFEEKYGFSEGQVGLTYIGIGAGMLVGVAIFGFTSDRLLKRKRRLTGKVVLEDRLVMMIPGAVLIPLSLLIYGWTAQYKTHWMVPIFGSSLLGLGLNTTFMAIQTYLVDAFTLYAASALAANTVLRSLVGALLPLAGPPMYQAMGLGWGNTLLAGVAVGGVPMVVMFLKKGGVWRKVGVFGQAD